MKENETAEKIKMGVFNLVDKLVPILKAGRGKRVY